MNTTGECAQYAAATALRDLGLAPVAVVGHSLGEIVAVTYGGGLTVPSEAVQTVEGASVVFVQVEGGFKAVPVLIGRQAGGRTEIVQGLNGSEKIAGANAFLLKAELAKGEAEHGH